MNILGSHNFDHIVYRVLGLLEFYFQISTEGIRLAGISIKFLGISGKLKFFTVIFVPVTSNTILLLIFKCIPVKNNSDYSSLWQLQIYTISGIALSVLLALFPPGSLVVRNGGEKTRAGDHPSVKVCGPMLTYNR